MKKTRRLMGKFSVAAVTKKAKRWIKTDDMELPDMGIPNLTKVVLASTPNRVWCTDFTYLSWK